MTTAIAIFMVGLIFMAVALMATGYMFKRPALALGSSGAWLVMALVSYTISTALWDVFYGLFWFGILMIVVSGFEAFYVKEKPEPEEIIRQGWEEFASKMEERRDSIDRVRSLRRVRPRRRNRDSDYAKTGKP